MTKVYVTSIQSCGTFCDIPVVKWARAKGFGIFSTSDPEQIKVVEGTKAYRTGAVREISPNEIVQVVDDQLVVNKVETPDMITSNLGAEEIAEMQKLPPVGIEAIITNIREILKRYRYDNVVDTPKFTGDEGSETEIPLNIPEVFSPQEEVDEPKSPNKTDYKSLETNIKNHTTRKGNK